VAEELPPVDMRTTDTFEEHRIIVFEPSSGRGTAALCNREYRSYLEAHLPRVSVATLVVGEPARASSGADYAKHLSALLEGPAVSSAGGGVLLQFVVPEALVERFDVLVDALRQATSGRPGLTGQALLVDAGERFDTLIAKLKQNRHAPEAEVVRYESGRRMTRSSSRPLAAIRETRLDPGAARTGDAMLEDASTLAASLEDGAVTYLTGLVSEVLIIPRERIDSGAPLARYGVDSLSDMRLVAELEKSFGELSKTLLFEFQDIDALARYFVREHPGPLAALLERERPTRVPPSGRSAPDLRSGVASV
jgi:hypothetical protein